MYSTVPYVSAPEKAMRISTNLSLNRLQHLLLLLFLHNSQVVLAAWKTQTAISWPRRVAAAFCPLRISRPYSTARTMSSTSCGGVAVVGSANQDLISYTPILPTLGETVMGTSFETSYGGKGANQAVAAASLGIVPVTMVCRVGQDSFGADLLANFRKVGVHFDEETTMAQDSHSGVAPIVVDTTTGDNMIVVIPGANHVLAPDDVRTAILAAEPAVVVSQLEIRPATALEAMKTGKQVGAITILNPAPAPEGWALDEFYPFVDILIPNETELLRLCKVGSEQDMARSLLKKGVGKAVVVTLGARGAMVVTKTGDDDAEVTLVKAPEDLPCRDEPVQDTIGAGDAFCGALSTYLSAGLELTDAATKACGVASMSVRKKGAQTSYPTANELPECLKVTSLGAASAAKPAITFVTGNKKKVEEIKRILLDGDTDLPFEITNRKIDLPELQGDPLEIAEEKCRLAAKTVNGPVLTEDTSLCFNSLNGLPGPYIKWFLEKCGHDGLNSMLDGFEDKSAYAQTVMAFTMGPGQKVALFDGRTAGMIVPPRGSLDFGWDPVFEPLEGNGKTYAEMTKEEKNAISHRARSMAKLQIYLHNNADDIIAKK